MSRFSFADETLTASMIAGVRGAVAEYLGLIVDGWTFLFGRPSEMIAFDIVTRIDETAIAVLVGPDFREIGNAPLAEASSIETLIEAALAMAPARPKIALAVSASLELVIKQDAPLAPSRLLDAIVSNETRACSPFPPERMRVAWAHIGATSTSQTFEAVILDAELIDPLVLKLADCGAPPVAFVRFDKEKALWACHPNWLTEVGGVVARASRLPRAWRPLIAASGLVAASAALNLLFNVAMLQRLGPSASEAINEARLHDIQAFDLATVAQARVAASQRIAVVDALAAVLDDRTYVEKLTLSKDEIAVVAVSPSAAEVLKAMSSIADLHEAGLQSGVTLGADNLERFTISAKIVEIPNLDDPT